LSQLLSDREIPRSSLIMKRLLDLDTQGNEELWRYQRSEFP
jgi:hypothetical protein